MSNSQLSPQAAAAELLARRNARRSLLAFTRYTYPQYIVDPVHRLIADALDRVVDGEIRRLMIFAPPQHGKSELVSVRLPAYWLGRRPDDPVIVASYGASLAEGKSRAARDILESNEYQALFGNLGPGEIESVGLRPDSRSVKRWQLAPPHRGGMVAVGVGGPVTGHGGMLGIIDDPHENWEQAQSQTYRNRAWEWWRGTFRTRIWEGGAIVVIMTRWHEDDLAGRLLSDQAAQWTVLRLPALAETQEERDANDRHMGLPAGRADLLHRKPGEALSPSRFSVDELHSIRNDVGSMVFAAEYQGAPRAAEGNLFKRGWFDIVGAAPAQAQRVRYWDKAGSINGDYTAGVLMAKDSDGVYYIEDVARGQWTALERERIIRQTAELDRANRGHVTIYVEQEPGSGGKESAEATVRSLAGFVVHAERATGDKATRAMPFMAQCEARNVKLVAGAWVGAYLDELTIFPNGANDDQVDGSSGAFNKLAENTSIRIVSRRRL